MKKFAIIAATVLGSYAAHAETWTVDKAHAHIGFTVTHMSVSEVEGSFKTFDAKVTSAKPDFSDASFNLTIDVNSVNTDNDMRDKHLKTPDYFDAAKYPTITFVSTSIRKTADKKYALTGNLTMHGVTKQVKLDMTLIGTMHNDMSKKDVAGFKITGKIDRKDFGVGAGTGGAMISTDVEILANGEFAKD